MKYLCKTRSMTSSCRHSLHTHGLCLSIIVTHHYLLILLSWLFPPKSYDYLKQVLKSTCDNYTKLHKAWTHYLSISFRYLSYAGKWRRFPVGAVRVSKVNLPLAMSATSGNRDANHTNASSPTSGAWST